MSSAATLRCARLAALAAIVLAPACADETVVHQPEGDAEESEVESARIGHIGIVVQTRQDEFGPAPAVRVEARFAEYRGLDPESARRRANIPRDHTAGLAIGQCAPSDRLTGLPTEPELERELTLVDGGDLRVVIGGQELFVPLALVPDLLPWVSGVEYLHVGENLSQLSSTPDGLVPVSIRLEGSPDDGLGTVDLSLGLPPRFELLPAIEAPNDETPGAVYLRWEPPRESTDVLVLQLTGHSEVAAVGDEVTCLVWDSGEARLDMSTLRDAGLGDAELIRVTASRVVRTQVDAGAFEGIDVVLELRDQLFVSAP